MQDVSKLLREAFDRLAVAESRVDTLTRRLETTTRNGTFSLNAPYTVPVQVVDVGTSGFMGDRLEATPSGTEVDLDLNSIEVDAPDGLPPVGAIVPAMFVGVYTDAETGEKKGRYVMAGSPGAVMFLITSIGNDYLTCTNYHTEETAYLFKPYLLQRTPFDGKTVNGVSYSYASAVTRTASKAGEDDEEHKVTPDYVVGQPVYGAPICSGMSEKVGVYEPEAGAAVPWVDINVDGRVWATED
jgi:hypothetical protein